MFYFHTHGKGDTISYYGTPGTAAKFLGLCQDDKKMHPAGKGALDLFESFVDRKYRFISHITSSDRQITVSTRNEKTHKQIWPL